MKTPFCIVEASAAGWRVAPARSAMAHDVLADSALVNTRFRAPLAIARHTAPRVPSPM